DLHALSAAADLILTSPSTFLARPITWLEMITRYRATCAVAPDFGYMWCARRITDQQLDGIDLSSLTMAVTGAERIKPSTLDAFTRRFGPHGFQPQAWAASYGMAEATLMITSTRQGVGPTITRFSAATLEHHHAEPDPDGTPLVASGRTADLRLRITDPHTHEPLPDRRIGEIWVSGISLGDGYHHQPDATANTFHHAADGTWLRTGDLGFLHNEDLYVTGRLKETVIINGRNLYPHDLEDAAHRAHCATGHGAAFAITAPDGHEHAVLIQELRDGHPSAKAITDAITTAIGQQFQIPIGIILVPAGTVRRTTSGKIRRHHMRDLLQTGEIHIIHQELTPAITSAIRTPA
ncbi:MAG TPA: AMP-binding protein, partial [Pseudonocardiaceae bacterium]